MPRPRHPHRRRLLLSQPAAPLVITRLKLLARAYGGHAIGHGSLLNIHLGRARAARSALGAKTPLLGICCQGHAPLKSALEREANNLHPLGRCTIRTLTGRSKCLCEANPHSCETLPIPTGPRHNLRPVSALSGIAWAASPFEESGGHLRRREAAGHGDGAHLDHAEGLGCSDAKGCCRSRHVRCNTIIIQM